MAASVRFIRRVSDRWSLILRQTFTPNRRASQQQPIKMLNTSAAAASVVVKDEQQHNNVTSSPTSSQPRTKSSSNNGALVDLRTSLNTCKSNSPSYTRIADLREECGYVIQSFERVTTPFGETVVTILEGQVGDDYYLRVYLPRRFNLALSDQDIEFYNTGYGDRLRLVKHSPQQQGSGFTPLEFV